MDAELVFLKYPDDDDAPSRAICVVFWEMGSGNGLDDCGNNLYGWPLCEVTIWRSPPWHSGSADESKVEPEDVSKGESKGESKDEPKDGSKDEPKDESKDEPKDVSEDESPGMWLWATNINILDST